MFLAALINGLGVKRLGKLAGHIAWGGMALCFVISALIFGQVWGAAHHDAAWPGVTVKLWDWFQVHNVLGSNRTLNIDMAFHVDQLTAVFLCFVSFIGTCVFIYATGYMKEKHNGHLELDPGYARFFAYVSLFAASMFTLVLGANLPVMFIGWEGVGLCSYLLIGYFFDKPFSENLSCADAGKKAFVMNRIGDAGLVVGMGLLFWGLGSLDFQELNTIVTSGQLADGSALPKGFIYSGGLITAATLCMFLGATGKSAQIPLFTWLPDAMAGPTPVSALIHAATMVTAGVYMIARMNVLYFMAPSTMAVIAIIGAFTAFAAATMAMTQRGIKKVLAYSTVSQLGYMFLGLGVGSMAAGIFHVFTHAFFKGCLFLAAGSVIHAMHHEEDMFKMGGLKKYMPKTALAYGAATICIAGVPLTSGFFSKDEILYHTWIAGGGLSFLWIVGIVTAALTAIYMGRSFFLTFWGNSDRIDPHTKEHLHEAPTNMWAPVILLAVLALVVGFLNVPKGFGGGAQFHHFLAPVVDRGAEHIAWLQSGEKLHHVLGPLIVAGAEQVTEESYHGPEFALAAASGIIAVGGLAIAWLLFGSGVTERARRLGKTLRPLWLVSFNCWWWDAMYNKVFRDGTMMKSRATLATDKVVVDGAVNGVAELCRAWGNDLRRLQNGKVQMYGLVMFIGVCLFVLYFAIGMQNFLREAYAPEERDRNQAAPTVQTKRVMVQSPALVVTPAELASAE